jgi:hypothetical protein
MSRAHKLTPLQRQALWSVAGVSSAEVPVPPSSRLHALRDRGFCKHDGWQARMLPKGARELVPDVDVAAWERWGRSHGFDSAPAAEAWLDVRRALLLAWDGGAR